jgi:hypothetical protein
MKAVAAQPSSLSVRMLDDELDFDVDLEALELDGAPSSSGRRVEGPPCSRSSRRMPQNATGRPTPRPMASVDAASLRSSDAMASPPSGPRSVQMAQVNPGRRSSASFAAVDPHAAMLAFAGFAAPPSTIWGTPGYAARVMLRRRTLRIDLALARKRRSADVGLYEAALRAADDAAVRNGVIFLAAVAGFAALLVAATVQFTTG